MEEYIKYVRRRDTKVSKILNLNAFTQGIFVGYAFLETLAHRFNIFRAEIPADYEF